MQKRRSTAALLSSVLAIGSWSAGCGSAAEAYEGGLGELSSAVLAETGVGAQSLPDLAFASVQPTRTFHVAVNGNDANPGTAARPWRTVTKAARTLTAGQAALVHGGTYSERVSVDLRDGLPTAPIQLLAAPGEKPILRGGDSKTGAFFRLARRYWIVDGFTVNAAGSRAQGVHFAGARNTVVRRMDIFGGTGPSAVAVGGGTQDVGILDSKIHGYTWGTHDSHGIVVVSDTARILVKGVESWKNGGDSFQCQGPDVAGGTAIPVDITVEGNRFHEDRENAVDIKTCDRVAIRGNKFYGYRPAASAPQGAAMVVHMSARNILIEGNRLWNNGRGLSLGGVRVWTAPVTNVVVRGNLLFDHTTALGGTGDGLRIGTSRRVRLYHNTLVNMPNAGIKLGDGDSGPAAGLRVFDNLVVDTGVAMDVNLTGTTNLYSDRNLAWNAASAPGFKVNGVVQTLAKWRQLSGQDASSKIADPLFVADPRMNDFFTQTGSPARDMALTSHLSPCGLGPDVGFLESCS